jgi:AcrR family transcriptional regulator
MSVPEKKKPTTGKPVRKAIAERPRVRRRLEPQQRREEIVHVAAEVFAGKGYRAANVTDIVQKAGIGRGTFYLYFESKKDVFLQIIERYFSGFEALLTSNQKKLKEALAEGGNVLGVWRGNVIDILEYHRDNPELTSVVYRDGLGSDEHFSARVDELTAIARRELRKDFELLKASGLLRPFDTDIITNMILGSSIYVIMENVVNAPRADLQRLADEMIEYYIRALIRTDLAREAQPWQSLRSS